jgi:Tfp pilus assembly protein PilX
MKLMATHHAQRGATLVVGMIMLVLITLVVTTAFSLSTSNLKSVGNMQFRDETTAAATIAIERVISSNFYTSPVAQSINVDLNHDNTTDYVVSVAAPTCVRAIQETAASTGPTTLKLPVPTTTTYMTLWDIAATVTDATSGASIQVHQGVKQKLTSSEYTAVCS